MRPARLHLVLTAALLVVALAPSAAAPAGAHPGIHAPAQEAAAELAGPATLSDVPCTEGFAATYPCQGIDLLSYIPHSKMGGGGGNDIWGWTDPQTGHEYALVGKTNGTAFVDITIPEDPLYLGLLPSHAATSLLAAWRDVKVYQNHAYIVAEEPFHGMQVFDLTRLRGVTAPQTWTEDAHYPLQGSAHNVAINEETGYAYILGSGLVLGVGGCSGLHMVDIGDPTLPLPAGCFELDGYTHDTQCVIYRGPDERFKDQEVCLNSNEDTLTIVDVTNKLLPEQLSRTGYPGANYTHQGWLTEDHRYFLLGDEGDEQASGVNTTTYVFDVSNLTAPQLIGTHRGRTRAIDHNLYVRDSLAYEANYTAGLQVYDIEGVSAGELREVAYFDLYPANDNPTFSGAWSNYPFFESGVVILNGMQQGLFTLRLDPEDFIPEEPA